MSVKFLSLLVLMIAGWMSGCAYAQHQKDPWTEAQLMDPGKLAGMIKTSKATMPMIISVGPGALVAGSIDIGPVSDTAHMARFEQLLAKTSKDAAIVIYCGCCPFEHCPNVRPAFNYLTEHGFTHYQLLNLPHNIRMDWVDKGYPVQPLP